jgi:hypothetical protein
MDFALYKAQESEKFDVLVFGDPQIKTEQEIGYFYHDAIEEVTGLESKFGVILGDIVFDNQKLYQDIDNALSLTGINFYRIPGNHDMDYKAAGDEDALENYKKLYGPPYYSFNYGDVHFIVLDNIIGKRIDKTYLRYNEGLTDRQVEFVKNDLALVSKDKLIVVMGHANFTQFAKNKKEILDVLSQYPNTLSIAGHDHRVENIFLNSKDGWNGKQPHHIFIAGAVCGEWWQGFPGEDGIPNSMMSDGSPNGYSIVTFDKNKYSIRYKAFGKDKDYQMIAYLPDEMTPQLAAKTEVILNIFAGSEKDVVEMSIDSKNNWNVMERKPDKAPYFLAAVKEEKKYKFGRYDWSSDNIGPTPHIWKANLPENLSPGAHIIYFRTTDMYGHKYSATRVFRTK